MAGEPNQNQGIYTLRSQPTKKGNKGFTNIAYGPTAGCETSDSARTQRVGSRRRR
jgi:hypothetical protein